LLALLVAIISLPVTEAVFVPFDNCISDNAQKLVIPNRPLQFVPYFMDVHFNTTSGKYTLNTTIYGNVTGQGHTGPYHAPNDPYWNSPDSLDAKIPDFITGKNYTTLFATTHVLSYTPYSNGSQFCAHTVQTGVNNTCPLGPLFNGNASDPSTLHAFSVTHDYGSSYAFSTFWTEFTIKSGDETANILGCISAGITPDLGKKLSDAIAYIPMAILALVGLATVMAAKFSPWSSSDFFHWTSNYGRDRDVLRLVTPGFGDCLQYIQFIVLAGSLSLNYPGYYQPVVSQASWSVLMFNESFVSHGNGTQSLKDGIYSVNGTYGLSRLSQLAGMTHDKDIWAGMAVWVCVIIASVTVLCQIGFASSWIVRKFTKTPEEDLQSKNLQFTGGNVVRVMFNFFLLPIVTLSLFQLVMASRSPASVVAMAVILIIVVILFALWLFRLIFTTKPRVHLFDHLPLLLLYGPLYNTYSDEAAPYAFIPFLLTCIRGIAIGAVQPSGIVQLIILAICEVVLILTLHAFRPFHNLTSMNAYHTFFSVIRLLTTLIMVAFVPSLGVAETVKGWIGYAVLLLHAIVLIFGFFLNAMQTLIEVFARLAQPAAGRDARGGLATVFGVRQLSKRVRRDARNSLGSNATALTESRGNGRRTSSAMLLHAASADHRGSRNFDQFSHGSGSMISGTSPGPSTPGGAHSPFSFIPGANQRAAPGDPYYRPPRLRRPTNEMLASADPEMVLDSSHEPLRAPSKRFTSTTDIGDGHTGFSHNRGSIGARFLHNFRSDNSEAKQARANPDYATRESDFYYGVRGPALSSMPSRRLKTGPADPMSPVASAKGWFSNMFAPKAKDKKKGFEVVRSTPLHLLQEQNEEPAPGAEQPYHDGPDAPQPRGLDIQIAGPSEAHALPRESEESYYPEDDPSLMRQISNTAPMLGPIQTGGSLHLPSRSVSGVSHITQNNPNVPRQSFRRLSSGASHP
ncbi:hypothetical protein EJ08DRAFT_570902, partial [Tothia fuscella]